MARRVTDLDAAELWCEFLSISLPFGLHALTWRESRRPDGCLGVEVQIDDGRVLQAIVEFPPATLVGWFAARRCLRAEIVAQAWETP